MMAVVRATRISWARAFLSSAWACWPAFLFYLLLLQPPVVSRSRLAISALLVPALAMLAYRTLPQTRRFLSPKDWTVLLMSSGIFSILAALPLSQAPQKIYLLTPQHTLRIEAVQIAEGQVVRLNWFHTSLGDVSLDSLAGGGGREGAGNILSLTSDSGAPLTWHGWTGNAATLAFSGSRGAVFKVTWDGVSKRIDFAQTGGRAQFEYPFVPAWWQFPAIVLLLWGACFFLAVMAVLNSQIKLPQAYLPAWVGWMLLIGPFLALTVLVWNVQLEYLQLPLVLALTALLVTPVYIVADKITRPEFLSNIEQPTAEILRKHSTLLTLVCSLALGLGIFGLSVWSNWAFFDDHEIMLYVGPGHTLTISQMLHFLPGTEIGQFGESVRFRPAYWFLRLLECVVWGAHPYYWHALRIVILVLAMALFWNLMSASLGWLGGGLLCAYTLTFPVWREVVGWLGPGETYALAGLPVYIWGMATLLRPPESVSTKTRAVAGAAVFLASLVCIGSKEIFVVLAFPSLSLAYRAVRTRDLIAFLTAIGGVAFAAYVGSSVILAVGRAGVDVYSHSISPLDRIASIFHGLQPEQNLVPLVTLVALTVAPAAILLFRGGSVEVARAVLSAQSWLAAFCLIYLSQVYVYNGAWPDGTRYDYPGILYIPAAIYTLFGLGLRLTSTGNRGVVLRAARSSLVIALTILVISRGYGPTMQFLANQVRSTNSYVGSVEKISSVLDAHADHALVVESGSPADYELIFSYLRFLRAYGARNSLFLRIHGYSLETAKYTQEVQLTADLLQVSANGNSGFDPLSQLNQLSVGPYPGFLPLSQLKDFGPRCFSLSLSGPFATECEAIQ
jgi:hypothetical protein